MPVPYESRRTGECDESTLYRPALSESDCIPYEGSVPAQGQSVQCTRFATIAANENEQYKVEKGEITLTGSGYKNDHHQDVIDATLSTLDPHVTARHLFIDTHSVAEIIAYGQTGGVQPFLDTSKDQIQQPAPEVRTSNVQPVSIDQGNHPDGGHQGNPSHSGHQVQTPQGGQACTLFFQTVSLVESQVEPPIPTSPIHLVTSNSETSSNITLSFNPVDGDFAVFGLPEETEECVDEMDSVDSEASIEQGAESVRLTAVSCDPGAESVRLTAVSGDPGAESVRLTAVSGDPLGAKSVRLTAVSGDLGAESFNPEAGKIECVKTLNCTPFPSSSFPSSSFSNDFQIGYGERTKVKK